MGRAGRDNKRPVVLASSPTGKNRYLSRQAQEVGMGTRASSFADQFCPIIAAARSWARVLSRRC